MSRKRKTRADKGTKGVRRYRFLTRKAAGVNTEKLFWSKVEKTDYCWNWTAGKNQDGYGWFNFRGKPRTAHRVSLILNNVQVPNGLVADHICRNRACVNPAHIRLVPQSINALENSTSFAAINRRKTHCPVGHELSGENLRIEINNHGYVGRRCRACAIKRTAALNLRKKTSLKRS